MRYSKVLVFAFIFAICTEATCPAEMDSGSINESNNERDSGQTQTFLAVNSGLANGLKVSIKVLNAPVTITATLKSQDDTVLDSGTYTANSAGNDIAIFGFAANPAIVSGTQYKFTLSSSTDYQVWSAFSYADGELSVQSGDYAFTFETICDYSSLTCPDAFASDMEGYGSVDLSTGPSTQTFVAPLSGTVSSFQIKIYTTSSDKKKRSTLQVSFYDDADTLLYISIISPTNAALNDLAPTFDVVQGSTYKFTIDQTSDWVVETTRYDYQAGELNGQTGIDQDIYFSCYVDCTSGTSGDPHFYGFKGQKYDVMGQSFEVYNLVTSPYFQLNSHFIPYYKTATQATPTGTMIGDLGVKLYSSKFYVNANSTFANIDGHEVSLRENWKLEIVPKTSISNVVDGNNYELTIDTADLTLTFIRKVYYVVGLEPQYHFDYKANLHQANKDLHGLLGQTHELKEFAEKSVAFKYVDGGEDDYRILSNDVFGDDFKYNKFANL